MGSYWKVGQLVERGLLEGWLEEEPGEEGFLKGCFPCWGGIGNWVGDTEGLG